MTSRKADTPEEAGRADSDCWDCSGKQRLHVVEVDVPVEDHDYDRNDTKAKVDRLVKDDPELLSLCS